MESSAKPLTVAMEPSLNLRIRRATQMLSPQAQWRLFILALVFADVILTGFAFWLAYYVRFNAAMAVFETDAMQSLPFYRQLSLSLVLLWLVIFYANGLYNRQNLLGGTQEYALVFRATSIGMLLVIIIGFLEPRFVLARGWLLLAWLFAFSLAAFGRFWLRRLVYGLRQRGYFLTSALIVGANEEACSLAQQLLSWRTSGLYVLGFVDDHQNYGSRVYDKLQVLGNTRQLDQLIELYGVQELILATSALSRDEMLSIFKRFGMVDDLNLRLSSGLFELITTGLEVKEMAYVPLVRVNKVRLTGLDQLLKLGLDYAVAIPGLIAILPAMIAIALAIKLDSPGPVLHRRRVMGLNGQQFDAFKFRSMHVNGDEILAAHPELKAELARYHKLKDDPRITRVGQLLRKYSLDELPQLLNVIRREMSLVGPRMISPEEMVMYNQWGTNLLTVRPGITGLWQVSGRSDVAYEERVRLDMHYIRNWTIWSDLHLLLQTIPAVIRGRGAY